MRLGMYTSLYPELDIDGLITLAKANGISAFEFSAKIGRGLKHFDPAALADDADARARFLDKLGENGIIISQLAAFCNPVSPIPGEAEEAKDSFEKALCLAEKLGVDTVCSFSGCPGGGPEDKTLNWITCPWPPIYSDMLKWQWEEKLIPFWQWAAKTAAEHGVDKLSIEMHPGFCVYNPETLLKLRQAVGPAIGANFDPSHLVWQGIDIPEAIKMLKGVIWHTHAKDTFVDKANVRRNGNLDTKHYGNIAERAWTFRTVGYGMGLDCWKSIISTLRTVGYDGVMSIEHEDMLLSKQEGIEKAAAFLKPILFEQSPGKMWWA